MKRVGFRKITLAAAMQMGSVDSISFEGPNYFTTE